MFLHALVITLALLSPIRNPPAVMPSGKHQEGTAPRLVQPSSVDMLCRSSNLDDFLELTGPSDDSPQTFEIRDFETDCIDKRSSV